MEQVVKELFKPTRKSFPRRRTIVKGLNDLWQTDSAEFIPYSKANKGYIFILFMIDCFSKYRWVESVKNKSSVEITKACKNVFKRVKQLPRNIQSNMGIEYYNTTLQKLFKKYAINHYSTFSV